VSAFQTRGAHVFRKRIFSEKDKIVLLVAFLCVTEGAQFGRQASKVTDSVVSHAQLRRRTELFQENILLKGDFR
jgi:hypothetical protein